MTAGNLLYIDGDKNIKTAQINQEEFENPIVGLNLRSYTQYNNNYLGINDSTTLLQLQSLVPLNSIYTMHVSTGEGAIANELSSLTILSGELILLSIIGGTVNVYVARDDSNRTSVVFYRFYSTYENHGFDKGWQRVQFA